MIGEITVAIPGQSTPRLQDCRRDLAVCHFAQHEAAADALVGNGPDGNNVRAYAQTNRGRFDVVGRTFRVSAKVEF